MTSRRDVMRGEREGKMSGRDERESGAPRGQGWRSKWMWVGGRVGGGVKEGVNVSVEEDGVGGLIGV